VLADGGQGGRTRFNYLAGDNICVYYVNTTAGESVRDSGFATANTPG
jgi:hypothetical protein